MRSPFSTDSPLTEKINTAADFLIVNLLYLILCLPVVTVGAAKSALYAASLSYLHHQESGAKVLLQTFHDNFRSITPVYLLLLPAGI